MNPTRVRPHKTESRSNRWRTAGALSLAAALAAMALASCGSSDASSSQPPSTVAAADLAKMSGIGAASMPPWPAPQDPQKRAELAGLPMGPMGMAEHYHPMLRITVDGEAMELPANIGVDPMTGQMSGLHTHTPDGVIHIEAAEKGETFTLGQLFTEWDVKLGRDTIGGLGADGSGTLNVTVDGNTYKEDPAALVLKPEQQIELDFTSAP